MAVTKRGCGRGGGAADASEDALPGFVEFECAAAALPPKSSAFLQVMRWVNGEFQVFHRSEAVYDSDEPKFGSESRRRADRSPVTCGF